jgi:hypothetical protein
MSQEKSPKRKESCFKISLESLLRITKRLFDLLWSIIQSPKNDNLLSTRKRVKELPIDEINSEIRLANLIVI